MLPALLGSVGTSVSVAAQVLAAVVLSWICVELYLGVRNPRTHRGDAMMLDLGLAAVTDAVLWLSVSLKVLF